MELVKGIQKAIDYIEENLLEELKYEEIAKRAYISSFHFQRIFSMVCGITLGEYIRNRRLSLSKEEILNTDINIINIAFKYGYKTPDGYTRAFYRYYGVTPSAARARKCKLNSFEKISVQKLFKGESDMINDLDKMNDLSKRGYIVKNSGVVYYTKDMDKTVKWFRDILGWYAGIDAKNDEETGVYGCALPFPGELVHMNIANFNGIHFFNGEPHKRTTAFINVQDIGKLYSFVKENGWNEITEVKKQPWGGKTCHVTTIDDSILTFCEIC